MPISQTPLQPSAQNVITPVLCALDPLLLTVPIVMTLRDWPVHLHLFAIASLRLLPFPTLLTVFYALTYVSPAQDQDRINALPANPLPSCKARLLPNVNADLVFSQTQTLPYVQFAPNIVSIARAQTSAWYAGKERS